MGPNNTKTTRAGIYIGGTGLMPVMHFSHGEPEPHGAENEITLTIETPTHRYSLHRMLTYEDYLARSKFGQFPTYAVKAILGAAYDPKKGICRGDPKARPSSNHLAAVQWHDDSWEAKVVDVKELTSQERMVHHQTLNREAGDGWLRDSIGKVSKELQKNIPILLKVGKIASRAIKQTQILDQKLHEGIERISAIDSKQVNSKKKWWQNVLALYNRQPENMGEREKWLEVAHIVVSGAIEQSKNPNVMDRRSDYLTTLRLKRLIARLNTGNRLEIRKKLATNLRVSATREKEKAEKAERAGKQP